MKKLMNIALLSMTLSQAPIWAMHSSQDAISEDATELKQSSAIKNRLQAADEYLNKLSEKFYSACDTVSGNKRKLSQALYWASLLGFNVIVTNYIAPEGNEFSNTFRHILQLIVAETITKTLEEKNGIYASLASYLLGVCSGNAIYYTTKYNTGFNMLGILVSATTITDRLKKVSHIWYGNRTLDPERVAEAVLITEKLGRDKDQQDPEFQTSSAPQNINISSTEKQQIIDETLAQVLKKLKNQMDNPKQNKNSNFDPEGQQTPIPDNLHKRAQKATAELNIFSGESTTSTSYSPPDDLSHPDTKMANLSTKQTIEEGTIINVENDADDHADPELALFSSNPANS